MRLISFLRRKIAAAAAVLGATTLAATAMAAGPRWVAGPPFYGYNYGNPVVWYTTQPQYFTDPSDLSPYVNHAAADAMVAAAASTWNLSLSSIVLAQGGALDEHVSSANVYLGQSGPVFPADVQASNFNAKQIAVIYDTDGSVTDTLLGGGASDPGNCRQSAVTESVDGIYGSGQIVHALIILNGRCTGSASALQMEMKYRLIRAFGRILGLGWSQLNDNAFTQVPQPTTQQLMNWPVMHPIDVLCGPYAYQCMLQPFTLRTDDMASLIAIYPVYNAGNGKTASFDNAASVIGQINFPNGQGMEGLLASVRRYHFGPGYTDAYDLTSGVTGATFQQNAGNPVTPKGTSAAASNGTTDPFYEGFYRLGWIPIPTADYFDNFTVTTSAVNPLYTGQYAVGPYVTSQVTPSGPSLTTTATVIGRGYQNVNMNMTATAAPPSCPSGGDGSASTPLAAPASGSWSDTLCGYQHSAFTALQVQAGRSLTIEVTATDEQGYATTGKMLPVIGIWDSNDSTSALPTLASQAAPLNASTLGMTNLMVSNATARTMRIGVADQRGDGRPDYGYNARILYANTISPSSLPANGGVVTISGMGFHPGSAVTINGTSANVTNWTATSITLVAPPITGPLAADVVVTDLSTGGRTTMSGALTYSQTESPDVLTVVSKPANGGYVGSVGSPAFKVQVMLPDGVTPAPNVAVTLSSSAATFGACSGAATCALTTDSSGYVSSPVTPTSAGTITLTATAGPSSVSTTFTALPIPVDGLTVLSLPSGTVYATLPATTPFSVKVTLPNGTVAAGASVLVTATNAALGACAGASTCTLVADASGVISTNVTPAAAGIVSLLATAGGGMVSASFGATALPADVLHVVSKPADASYVGRTASTPFALQVMLGDNATPASGIAVTLTASGAAFASCGASTCVLTADMTGFVSTSVIPTAAGTVTLAASAGGGTVSASFTSVVMPPDALHLVSKPADGSYVARVAAIPFNVQVALGDTGAAAAGASVTVSTTNGVLNACGAATCTLTADSTGTVSTTVTPSVAGAATLTASAGGGTLSASFLAANIPPDTLTILTKPANGSYVSRTAALPFAVQTVSGETGAPASAISVTVTAINATLSACSGTSSCVLTADSTGTISTSVTPTSVGTVSLSAAAGGGTASTTFSAIAIPPDALHVVSQPANGSYVGRTAATAFVIQVALGDTGAPAAGVSVIVSATNAVLNACGASTCTLTADGSGTISTTVTPSAAGAVNLTAAAGGGTISATFNAVVVPPDTLTILTKPANGSYVGRTAAIPFAVQVALGDGSGPASGVSVTVSGTNATLNTCGASTCILIADSAGTVSTSVTPSAAGSVSLTAAAGGGTASAAFSAINVPPDALQVVTKPANGSYVGRTAAIPFAVQVALGDTGAAASGVSVTLTATNAILNVCGLATCTVTTDASGTVSTTVTPSSIGSVGLTAAAGGGTVSTGFSAVAIPPDTLNIATRPANGSYVGRTAAIPFTVQVALGDTGGPAAGVSVTVAATNAVLNACGLATCTLTANASGSITTTVTPSSAGSVGLTASAGGGAISTTFTAVAVPPDAVHIVAQPLSASYVGRTAATSFTVQITLGDTGAAAAGISVTLSATNAILNVCGASSCTLTADSTGTVSTTVLPSTTGTVVLTASAGGGSASTSFSAVAIPPDALGVVTQPANGSYIGNPATLPFTVQVALGDTGAPAANVGVLVSATNATLNACGAATCTLTTDSAGIISTTVTPTAAGAVTLSAGAGGGSVSTSFLAAAIPPDTLNVVTRPADGSYIGRVATLPFSVQILDGETGLPAAGASVAVTATGATLAACANTSSCVLTADPTGTISTSLTPSFVGIVSLSASVNGGAAGVFFNAVAVPPDTLTIVTQPASGSYVGRQAAVPFAVQVALGDTGGPASAVPVTVTATNAVLNACSASSCILTADSTGTVSTAVTPSTAGPVSLSASAGGGTVSTTFNAIAVPPDVLTIVTQPPNGSYVGRTSTPPFAVQVALGDTGAPAVGVSVTFTATNATLNSCGATTCSLTTDATGTISTTVTPSAAGAVSLSASAGGGTVSASFSAVVVPPDALLVMTHPANGSYVGRASTIPFAVQVASGDTGAPAVGISVTVTATNATLNACGAATCPIITDATGTISTTVTPSTAGAVSLSAGAGGGTVSATFNAIAVPPDTLTIETQPANGSYVGRQAALPFTVQVALGDTGGPASAASVTVTATNGAVLNACGASSCTLTADSTGAISTTVTPSTTGAVSLSASAGGGTVSTTFSAVVVPPDALLVVTHPANGSYVGRTATIPFAVQVALGDTGAPAAGVSVSVSATNATLNACGAATCTMIADPTGTISTTITPSAPGSVSLSASAGGGTVTTTFSAVAVPPDTLTIVTQPTNGSYVGRQAALPFTVQVELGDASGPASTITVTVTATNATLNACGAATCALTADATGTISTSVTPSAAGAVSLSSTAGGGTVSTTFNAVVVPPDALHVLTQPANGSYAGRPAAIPFSVQVVLGDTGAPVSGITVTLSATNATLSPCGASTCTLTADPTGTIATTVTPTAAGLVSLTASAGGGTVSTTFTAAVIPPDTLTILAKPAEGSYAGRAATVPFTVQIALGDTGAPASAVSVTLSTTNAILNACGASTCILAADSTGTISTTVTPSAAGAVTLIANAGGGTISTTFSAAAIPPDALHLVTKPADGAYVGRAAVLPFTLEVALGDTGAPAAGASVTIAITNGTLSACPATSCTLTADSTGSISTMVTPTAIGPVGLFASAGGGTLSTTFTAIAVPPDALHVITQPATGSYVGRTATLPFTVQVALGDTGGPAGGGSVTVTATNATLTACAASTCTLIADPTGTITTTVTPSAPGPVNLTASAGGGTVSVSFNAVAVPPDALTVLTKPTDGSYVGRTATLPFAVQVLLGNTSGPAAAISVSVSATNATLGCGSSTCTLTTDATGAISTTVAPSTAGVVGLTASAGGGTVSTTFNAAAIPPDVLHVLTQPANGSYIGVPATTLFSVQTLLGDTGGPANGASITLTATNATLGCGASICTLPANIAGAVTTSVTPTTVGPVTLSASAGGGTVSTTFSAVAMPPDNLQLVTAPPDNTYVGSPAAIPFSVAILLGDAITPASGASVTVTSAMATFSACGLSTCTIAAGALGTISTLVTATSPGAVTLTASAGGGTVSTTFTAITSPDNLQILSAPSDHSLTNQVAATPFVVKATLSLLTNARFHALSSANSPDVNQPITLTAIGGKLNACGLPVCVLTTDSNGTVSTTVTPLLSGPVTLLAAGAGASTSTIFAADTPPDTLHVTSTPANGSYANRVASAPFAAQVLQGDGVTPAAGASVTLTATGATLGACGLSTCVVTADASGTASTPVTPSAVGSVQLTASAGGGTAAASFTSSAVPPDTLHVTAQPVNGSYVARAASTPFTVQTLLGDTNGPAAGASVTLSAVNATLGACGLSTCILTADSTGAVSTTVTPTTTGSVTLSASAGGGITSASFTAVAVPPDTLQITSHPANGSYVARVAPSPFSVQVSLGDTGGPATGASVTLSATGAILGACGATTCTLTTDSTGFVSTTVTPTTVGTVALTAAAGGGTASTTFTASAVPPDTLNISSQPANGSYAGRIASAPFTVQVSLGDTNAPATGASVTLSATNATFTACASATCVLTADATGTVSTTLTPIAPGTATLSATAGGGAASITFTSTAVPPDNLHIDSQPANGSYAARPAAIPFAVQVLLGDTGNVAAGTPVTLTANGASLGACGLSTCILPADSTGTASTTVTPLAPGSIQLTATAGGGAISTTFTAAAIPPDSLQIVSHPADGSSAGSPATVRFAVQILLGETGTPAAGATVTVTASNATLGACNASTCILTADANGTISTTVTPLAAGLVSLTVAAGGGTVSTTFTAAPTPVDTLRIVSQPSGTVYATLPAATPFTVKVMLPDGVTPASGASVTLTANHAALGSCGASTSCALTADASGTVSTTVTPQQAGLITLQANAAGGSVSTTFTASTLPANILTIVSVPSGSVYLGVVAAAPFAVHVLLGDGITPASTIPVTLSASGATFGSCPGPCVLLTDASGNISTTVTPATSGAVTLSASSGGGTVSSTFTVTPDVLHVLSSPADNTLTGSPAALPFALQVLLGDGVTPVPAVSVSVSASGATLSACPLATCILNADGQGRISTAITANAPGTVTLTASAAGATVSVSFSTIAPPDNLLVLSTPTNGSFAGRSSAVPFTVQVSLGIATNHASGLSLTPNTALPTLPGVSVTLSASGATLDTCGLSTCTLITGALGTVSTAVTPISAGPVNLSATAAGGTTTSSFTAAAQPGVLHVASVPANGTYVGRAAANAFTVQVFQSNGTTPASAVPVTLTASGAILGACGQPTCILTSDQTGTVSTTVTPSTAGTITLTAAAAGGTASASFTAATPPDVLNILTTPANGAYTGRPAPQPFTVKAFLGDGVTPAAGASVVLTATNAILGVCGASTCTSTADSTGTVSSPVVPALAGTVTLSASAAGGTASTSFLAIDPIRGISIARATEFVATGSTVAWTPIVTLLENGLPIAGIPVLWTSQGGLNLGSFTSTTNASGTATLALTIGPLASGSVPTGTVCAWTTVCTTFGAQAVDPAAWRLQAVNGNTQTLSPIDTLQPLTVRAVDDAGDWIAGVPIQINQLVRGWVACPPTGRCPLGPILSSGPSSEVSDVDGVAAITPLQVPNTPETTGIVVAAGPNGYLAISLSKVP